MESWNFARRQGARKNSIAGVVLVGSLLLITACTPSDDPAVMPTVGIVPAPSQTAGPTGNPTAPAEARIETAPLAEPVVFDTGVSVSITSATAGYVDAETPGEVSGSVVIVRVHAVNESPDTVDLGSAVVTVTAADGAYAVPSFSDPSKPFSGPMAPHAEAEATYVFLLDAAEGRDVEVTVNYAAGAPVAVFTGTISSEGDS